MIPDLVELPDNFWPRSYAEGWKSIIQGEIGARALLKLKAHIANANHRAVHSYRGDAFECGKAAGFQEAFEWLINLQLSAQPEESQTSTEMPSRGASEDILAQYAP